MAASWIPVWRVSNEGTEVVAYEATPAVRTPRHVTVRSLDGTQDRLADFWFQLYFGATPEEAIEKFLAVQVQRLGRLEKDRVEIEQQQANARALQAAARSEVMQ